MIENYKDGLYFVPLGGSEQFGVNLNVYMSGGKLLAIDCGVGFADERFPGIDLLLPDPVFLQQHQKNLCGLVITHAHEDHIGAVAHLWPRLKCPIYTTAFTAEVLRRKLEEVNLLNDVPLHVVSPEEKLSLKPFDLTFLPVAHSIPDSVSVLVEADGVKAMHSGDWNLDPAPVVGFKTQKDLFQKIGPVDAYVGDSTNAEVDGRAGSEGEVEDGLYEVFKKTSGRIFVTTFSSNVGRLISIARAAKRVGRDVGVIGRSMHRMIGAASNCGYMHDIPDFITEDDMGYLPDEKLVVICTGSQGEPRAALSKIARGDHRAIDSKPGDTVVFSARTIPGNEIGINEVKNNLRAGGVHVISPSDTPHKIHVSGHPCRDEILDMWSWIKPKLVVPVHGERMQLEAHAALAKTKQIPSLVPNNGSVVKLGPAGAEILDHVETGILAVDQKRLITAQHKSINDRRKLQYTGAAFASIVVNAKGKIVGEPHFETIGLIDENDDSEMKIEDKLYGEIFSILRDMSKNDLKDDDFIAEQVRIGLRRSCNYLLGIKPKTIVHVSRV